MLRILVMAVVVAACSPAQKTCSVSTCTGCCSSAGECETGDSADACGVSGEMCQTCSGACQVGVCSGTGGGAGTGGGNAGTGGGSSTGGSSGGGSACSPGTPHVMLVIDTSGSMNLPLDTTCSGSSCATRMTELKSAFDDYLGSMTSSPQANWGLWTFPSDNACSPGSSALDFTAANDTSSLSTQASQLHTAVMGLTAKGGTPTAATLTALGAQGDFAGSTYPRLVVLITDGVPNCNIDNPNTCVNAGACQCTITPQPTTMSANDTNFCVRGCLDATATVGAIADLKAHGIPSIVIGVGADVSTTTASLVLADMAAAGGVARPCSSFSDCNSGDSCTGGHCTSGAYFAVNGSALSTVLFGRVGTALQNLTSCMPP